MAAATRPKCFGNGPDPFDTGDAQDPETIRLMRADARAEARQARAEWEAAGSPAPRSSIKTRGLAKVADATRAPSSPSAARSAAKGASTYARGIHPARSIGDALGGRAMARGNSAGFVLGLVGYALVLSYIRGGPAGAKAWIAAKFWNQVPGLGAGVGGAASGALSGAAAAVGGLANRAGGLTPSPPTQTKPSTTNRRLLVYPSPKPVVTGAVRV